MVLHGELGGFEAGANGRGAGRGGGGDVRGMRGARIHVSATLVVTGALLVVTMFAIRNKKLNHGSEFHIQIQLVFGPDPVSEA